MRDCACHKEILSVKLKYDTQTQVLTSYNSMYICMNNAKYGNS